MTFPTKDLFNDEQVVIDQHPHWWWLVPRGGALLATMVLGVIVLVWVDAESGWAAPLRILCGVLLAVTLVAFLLRLVDWKTTMFVITTERCIHRTGVISKRGIEIPLDRINTVFFNQSVFERMIGAGDIGIESAGENSRQEFSDIRRPSFVQNEIYRLMEQYENRRQDRLGQVMGTHAQGQSTSPGTAATAPMASAGPTIPEQIQQLAQLRDQGHLTPDEFEVKKAELLSRM